MPESPFMPKATAVWLVENTTLTFKQIAEFCKLHELEIKGIADGDIAKGIKAIEPYKPIKPNKLVPLILEKNLLILFFLSSKKIKNIRKKYESQ